MSGLLADSRVWFTALIALVAMQRLIEVGISSRHARQLLARGGVEAGHRHLPAMILLHIGFLIAAPIEVWLLGRAFVPALAAIFGMVFLVAQALRAWAQWTLGGRWTVRVIVVPLLPPVTGGPYRFMRHPNYAAVMLEMLALPLIHTAWLTALVFSVLDGWLLVVRIRAEETLLAELTDYDAEMLARPRFVPRSTAAGNGSEFRS